MATHTFKMLKDTALLSASAAAVVTNATAHTTYINTIILHNTDTVDRYVQLWLVKNSGGSVGTAIDGNEIYYVVLTSKQTVTIELPGSTALSLEANNDTLQAAADVTNKVTITVKGDDLT